MELLLGFVLTVFCSASLTLLVSWDKVTVMLRYRFLKKISPDSTWHDFFSCFRCQSFWTSLIPTALLLITVSYFTHLPWWLSMLLFLPTNLAVSFAAHNTLHLLGYKLTDE